MTRRVVIRVLGAVVSALVVATALVAMTKEQDGGNSTFVGMFSDASPLEIGSMVRAAGVKVGNVQQIELTGGKARVTFTVEPSVLPLHRDAKLVIRPVNVLGENYVDLDTGSPSRPYLEPAVVPVQQTSKRVQLQDVLNTFDNPTSTNLATLLTTLGEGLHGSGADAQAAVKALAPAMRNTNELGQVLDGQNAVLTRLLDRVKPVAQGLADNKGKTLDKLVGSTQQMLGTLAANQQALDQTMTDLPNTVSTARRTLAQLSGVSDQATPMLESVRPVSDNLSSITDELQRLADSADPALTALQPVLQRGQTFLDQAAPAVADLRRVGPDLSSAAKNLRPVGDVALDRHLHDLMEFVRKWALSTNSRDALGHYFRGVVHMTPAALNDLLSGVLPRISQKLPKRPAPGAKIPAAAGAPKSQPTPAPGSPGGSHDGSATGLTPTQEQSMLHQLLGGF